MPGGTAAASAASCLAGAVMLEMSCSGEGDPCLDNDKVARKLVAQALHFAVVDGILYCVDPKGGGRKRVAVPVHLREGILHESHGGLLAGHFSGAKLYEAVSRLWWWSTLYKDVMECCRNCPECSGAGRKHCELVREWKKVW